MSGEIRYYKGKHKVRIVTQSEGYWIAEALEDFEDLVDDQKTIVKAGEQRILPPSLVSRKPKLPPVIKEHTYELQMEKKLKRLVAKEEQTKQNKKQTTNQKTG